MKCQKKTVATISPCSSWYIFLHIILLTSLMSSWPYTAASTKGSETDRLALLQFKNSISHDPDGVLSSWNESTEMCKWFGIKCSVKHHRVTALSLLGHNLHGTISPFIGNLSFLRFITLKSNSFSGEIPQQVDRLFRLQHLNLSFNMLEGKIPPNLTSCSNLEIISLAANRLIGTIPSDFGSFVNLVYLDLERNNLTGGIPASLGNVSSLRALSVSTNRLEGVVPGALGKLKRLRFFGIGVNNLSGTIPPSLLNMSFMTNFVITSNRLQGTIPPEIGFMLPSIQSFLIGGNEFSGTIPTSLANASQLQSIDIAENNFVGQVPANLGNLSNLRRLSLSANALGNYSANSMDFISSLTNCSQLEILAMTSNMFGGVLPKFVANLSTTLIRLYLGGNEISGNIPSTLENLDNLILLGLDNNHFTGFIPTSLGKLGNIQVLALHSNNLSGNIPSSIGNLTKVSRLNLSNNKLEGRIPPDIAKCQNLQLLNLANNRLSGAIPRVIFVGLSSSLLELTLHNNELTGNLPGEVEKLGNVHEIILSKNSLSGEIPEAIGVCESLLVLDLHDNIFRGSIPSTMASLRGLERLDLSRNNITGKIPMDLEKLKFLSYLNLSFNHLEGEVPSKGIFQNTSALSIVGNTNLCGGEPELKLPRCSNKEIIKRGKSNGLKLIVIVCVAAAFLLLLGLAIIFWRRRSRKESIPTVSTIGFLPKVSYKVLYQATNEFSPAMLIGVGSFSSVYKGILDVEDSPIAVKVLNLQKNGAEKSFIAECNALRTIRHRNLVKILTCCSSMDYNGNDFKALVFEYMSNGNLEKWVHCPANEENRPASLSLIQRVNIAIDIASAIHYLHRDCNPEIVHCDMKPSNVLLDSEMIAHVGDFGLARLISDNNGFSDAHTSTTGIKGTVGYVAPEYATGSKPSKEGDMYSYGILVLEMFTGRRPTDNIFKDDFNLHNFIKMSLPERILQIVDSDLLPQEYPTNGDDNNNGDVEIDQEQGNIDSVTKKEMAVRVRNCLVSVLEIGVACSRESPDERMDIGQVIRELQRIRIVHESVGIH